MTQQASTDHSLKTSLAPTWSHKLRAEITETSRHPLVDLARQEKAQFAPHRLVGSYSDYRRLAAKKSRQFVW